MFEQFDAASVGSLSPDQMAQAAAESRPGPVSASLIARLDSAQLSDDGRLHFLVATERLARWAASLTLSAVVDHVGVEDLSALGTTNTLALEQRGRAIDVSLALECSETWLTKRWLFGRSLATRLRQTWRCLNDGRLSECHAWILYEAVDVLTDDQAHEVEAKVLSKATDRTPGRFRQICRRAVVRADPQAIERRHRAAVKNCGVRWWPEADGMATLQMYASAPDVMAVHGALDVLAGVKQPGDERSREARRADALVDVTVNAVLPNGEPSRTRARGVEAQVVVDLPTLCGLADNPGELRGYGPIPAGVARDWLTSATTWRRMVTDPVNGQLVDLGPRRRFPTGALRDLVTVRDAHCTFPGCTRRADGAGVEVDHHPPWRADGTGGRTSAEQLGALCAHHHHVRTHGGWSVRHRYHGQTVWRSPAGRDYVVEAESVLAEPLVSG